MKTYLRDRQHYEDRYDRMTVENCRRSEAFFLNLHKKAKDKKQAKMQAAVHEYAWKIKKLYLTKRWYDNKESTIDTWMQEDEQRDKLLSEARPPSNILCDECYDRMYEDGRSLYERDGKDEVLFFMRCPGEHLPMKGVYEDGTERKREPILCPECKAEMKIERLPKKGKGVKTKYYCTSCGHEEIDDWTPRKEIPDPDFNKDRARFCLQGEALKEVQDALFQIEQMKSLVDEWKHKEEHQEEYDAVASLEKLTIPQVKARLSELLAETRFHNLTFEKPAVERFVSMEFSVEELETENQRASCAELKKRIKTCLENTNWRLMTGGIDYRLGLLTGRLRAYESEEDLLKLIS